MKGLKEFFQNWTLIFIWAWICIWEKIRGEEVSCPDCWKCTTARWIMFTTFFLILVGFIWAVVT